MPKKIRQAHARNQATSKSALCSSLILSGASTSLTLYLPDSAAKGRIREEAETIGLQNLPRRQGCELNSNISHSSTDVKLNWHSNCQNLPEKRYCSVPSGVVGQIPFSRMRQSPCCDGSLPEGGLNRSMCINITRLLERVSERAPR
jgi:hypothetical protein